MNTSLLEVSGRSMSRAWAAFIVLVLFAALMTPGVAFAQGLHGIAFAKNCVSPTARGAPYNCSFSASNIIDTGTGAMGSADTLTFTSIVDVVAANPMPVNSGNILPSLTLSFSGGASCNMDQTLCTLPPGGNIESAPFSFYTTDGDDPTPLTDTAALTWQDTCDSGANNCPVGDQTAMAGSQSTLVTLSIAIVKEISVDGGTTWFDANDVGSAPVVTFPSGALYRLTVENTGNITLENVVVNDATLGIVNYAVGTLTAGQVVVLTQAEIPELSVAERCGEAGEFENVAEASGAVVGGPTAMDQDPAFLVCEEEPVQFRVVKDFSDDNPAGVEVFIECNTGLPLQQQAVVHDPEAAGLEPGDFTVIVFVVQDFEPGTMDCDIGEAIPAGYVPDYTAGATTGIAGNIFGDDEGCHYEDVESGEFTCSVFNDLQPVEVIVEKIWIDDNPQFQQSTVVEVTLECDGPIIGGFPCLNGEGVNGNFCSEQFIDPNNPGEFLVLPHFDGTFCFATEEPIVGVLTDESDCEEMIVFPGQGDSCVIVNTRLFAGIPTLNQYGLILLALLMLGVGLIAYRRFA